jgi:hypothetical protein
MHKLLLSQSRPNVNGYENLEFTKELMSTATGGALTIRIADKTRKEIARLKLPPKFNMSVACSTESFQQTTDTANNNETKQ